MRATCQPCIVLAIVDTMQHKTTTKTLALKRRTLTKRAFLYLSSVVLMVILIFTFHCINLSEKGLTMDGAQRIKFTKCIK